MFIIHQILRIWRVREGKSHRGNFTTILLSRGGEIKGKRKFTRCLPRRTEGKSAVGINVVAPES